MSHSRCADYQGCQRDRRVGEAMTTHSPRRLGRPGGRRARRRMSDLRRPARRAVPGRRSGLHPARTRAPPVPDQGFSGGVSMTTANAASFEDVVSARDEPLRCQSVYDCRRRATWLAVNHKPCGGQKPVCTAHYPALVDGVPEDRGAARRPVLWRLRPRLHHHRPVHPLSATVKTRAIQDVGPFILLGWRADQRVSASRRLVQSQYRAPASPQVRAYI